jgi:hypothetical protein
LSAFLDGGFHTEKAKHALVGGVVGGVTIGTVASDCDIAPAFGVQEKVVVQAYFPVASSLKW